MSKRNPTIRCTVLRSKEVRTYNFNVKTGERTNESIESRQEVCGTPLFSEQERRRGICRSCQNGWENQRNRFANTNEHKRATSTDDQIVSQPEKQ